MIRWGGVVVAAAILFFSALARAVIPGLIGAFLTILVGVVVSWFLGPPWKMREQVTNLRRSIEEKKDKIRQMDVQLARLLREVGISAESLEAGVRVFNQKLQDRNDLLEYENGLELLKEKSKRLSSALSNLQDRQEQAGESKVRLTKLLTQAGLEVVSIEESLRGFEDACDKRKRYDHLERETASLEAQRTALLGDRPEAELANLREVVHKEIIATLASFPKLKGLATNKTLQELENEEQTVAQELGDAEKDVRELSGQIRGTLSDLRSRAEIEEDIARYEHEVAKLDRFAFALNMAKAVIEEAAEEVHRDIAPRLNKEVGDSLNHITNGRYVAVYVDPANLEVSLKPPELDEIVHADQLSLGTQQQIYLLLRVAIARTLSVTGETIPLILDDPFVNFDEPRLLRTLDLLVDISERNQVLLFTKSAPVEKWFKTSVGGASQCRILHLPAP
jgi:uncharacterized protein YhaN